MAGTTHFAYFVSAHGFGHAARAAAIVEALGRRFPHFEVELWTSVPVWFFEESLTVPFSYHSFQCDVGLVQKSPVEEDLAATLVALDAFWTVADRFRTQEVAAALVASGADCILCDIAPFGLDVARRAGLASVLIENFTWDWIYAPFAAAEPRFASWVDRLRAKFGQADLHLQLEPVCRPVAGAVQIPRVARAPRRNRAQTFERLGISGGDGLVLVSLGGVEHRLANLGRMTGFPHTTFVVPGASVDEKWEGNLRLLPHHSPIYHPDLVSAADVVVGKLGYSTVAEAVAAGTRMLYVPRPGFREAEVLERYVLERLPAQAITLRELASGEWVERLPALVAQPRPAAESSASSAVDEGSDFAAARIAAWWRQRSSKTAKLPGPLQKLPTPGT